jgi:hypothetical protein
MMGCAGWEGDLGRLRQLRRPVASVAIVTSQPRYGGLATVERSCPNRQRRLSQPTDATFATVGCEDAIKRLRQSHGTLATVRRSLSQPCDDTSATVGSEDAIARLRQLRRSVAKEQRAIVARVI